jgi:ribosomal protein L37AE/L43A
MDELQNFCCQNPECRDYGRRGLGNLRVAFRYGRLQQRRYLACRTCQHRFSERQGTALFDCRLPEELASARPVA